MSSYLYRGPQSPQGESFSTFSPNPLSPHRHTNRLSGSMASSAQAQDQDVRGGLTRRFTTNGVPTLSPIAQQRLQAAGENALNLAYNRVAPSERKIRHIENLLEQQRRINAELNQVDDDTRREIEEGLRHERAVTQFIAQSEPTTPPEYQDAFPTFVARPNRYSATSLTSPPSLVNRPHRSSTHLTSPTGGLIRPYTAHTVSGFPSQSVPGSRRHSDDEDDEFLLNYDTSLNRATTNPNRNSMPVTTYDRKRSAADLSAALGPLNTTSFLFEDDEKPRTRVGQPSGNPSSPDSKTFLQVQHTADGFPKLIRREDNGDKTITSPSAALDLALAHPIGADHQASDRANVRRHRISLPPSALVSNGTIAPLNGILAASNDGPANNRRSLEVKFSAETKRPSLMTTPNRGMSNGSSKPLSSYSTNDIPTLKSINGDQPVTSTIGSPPSKLVPTDVSSAERHPNGSSSTVTSARQSIDLSHLKMQDSTNIFDPAQGGLHGNALPFGPLHDTPIQQFAPPNMAFGGPPFYNAYGVQMLNNGFGGMTLNGTNFAAQAAWPGQGQIYQQAGFGGFQQFGQQRQPAVPASRFPRGPATSNTAKADGEDLYSAIGISQLHGQIYGLCKDQHGCRFLQKKLDERREQDVQQIFDEVKDHFTELMTDPFGNYLCQRLLEHANNEQRTTLIQNAAPSMTNIAVNQHGTRALQRMIEFITTKEQTQLLIDALGNDVVQLIQDLNGNHVIQKCLNHLSSEDAEFIFAAVGANCVTVGTHRHGCCVLQRCVDHASGLQKGTLVNCIVANALALVQDPFGNYVVQYVLDLSEPCFTQPLCHALSGNIAFLSKQKFSSNVIEKCIRCADNDTKRMLVQEIMNPVDLEKLLRDSFANYVVQTALDFCPEDLKPIFIENIRPALPVIRNTPHGRRIASKIQDHDFPGNTNWVPKTNQNGGVTPVDSVPSTPQTANGRGNRMGMAPAPGQWSSNMEAISPLSSTNGGPPPTTLSPSTQGFQMFSDAQMYQPNGFQAAPTFNTNGLGNHLYGQF